MKCSKCEIDNLPDANHCASCGEPIITAPVDLDATDVTASDAVATDTLNSDQADIELEAKPVFLPVGSAAADGSESIEKTSEYPNNVVTDLSEKKKSGKSFRVTMLAIILALAVICGLGFMFRNKILKQINPERYLQVSLSKTFLDKKNSKILDMSKYDEKAVKHVFSTEMEDVKAEVSVMYDAKGEKALFEAMIDDGFDVYDDNLFYISRQMFALSMPEMITDVDFITIDPATIGAEMAELGMEPELTPEHFDNVLDMFFGKSGTEQKDMDELAEYYREARFLEENADFSQGKTVTEKINGKSYKLDTMCYEISEETANQYLAEMLAGYKQGFMDGMGSMYQGYDLEQDQAAMDSAFAVFDDIRIEGDIKVTYYIDWNDYVRKIVVEDFEITMDGSDEAVTIDFEMLLGGKKSPSDNISVILTVGVDGEEVEVGMTWDESYVNGVFKGELELYAEGDQNTDDMAMAIEIEWNSLDKKGENFKAELTINGDDEYGLELTGKLIDGKSSTTFTDGELTMRDSYRGDTVFEFEYSISIIDPKDISIDLGDNMPLMEYIEQQEAVYSGDEYQT